MKYWVRSLFLFALTNALTGAPTSAIVWSSPAVRSPLTLQVLEPTAHPSTALPEQPLSVIFYLTGLNAPRIGTDSDAAIIADFRAAGQLVVVVDYAAHPAARVPTLNADFVQLRHDLQTKQLLADRPIDYAHIFVVPAGCRLLRDLVYFQDEAAHRTLAMDVIYPANPTHPVGAVLEFTCDNANRMGNFSIDFCTDTIVPAAALDGHAAAMVDHPVAAPYKGFDAMPASARKIKAAVRTLRASATTHHLPLNDRIVSVGFSRGSGMSLLLATTTDHLEFEGFGENPGVSSAVQGAVVMSGRFTYLDLLPDDHMIPRYEAKWGPRAGALATWRDHGALDYLSAPLAFPLFLTINATEGPDALHQMQVLRERLAAFGSPYTYFPENTPRGHKMPVEPNLLSAIQDYLSQRLAYVATDPSPTLPTP